MADYHPGQLVRIRYHLRPDTGGVVHHVTKTLVVLRDGRRFSLRTGRMYGAGVSMTRMEPWTRKAKS